MVDHRIKIRFLLNEEETWVAIREVIHNSTHDHFSEVLAILMEYAYGPPSEEVEEKEEWQE